MFTHHALSHCVCERERGGGRGGASVCVHACSPIISFHFVCYVCGSAHLHADMHVCVIAYAPITPSHVVCLPVCVCMRAENCVAIVEGEMGHDGVLHARALGFPPCEPRGDLPLAAKVCLNGVGGT